MICYTILYSTLLGHWVDWFDRVLNIRETRMNVEWIFPFFIFTNLLYAVLS